MATELVRRIRGTRIDLGRKVRNNWIKARNCWCEPLTFGDLEPGENFISLPLPGDNSGHEGLLSGNWLFKKIESTFDASEPFTMPYYNAIRLVDGLLYHMSNSEWVYKVL